jgi:hypothetical protein
VVALAAGLVLIRGHRVRLELHVLPPRVQLHVAPTPPAGRLPGAAAGLAEEADGEVPGEQVARDSVR